ncbi:MAG: Gldg family protein [Pirellulales bacterium]|nr:Gldg family protein [Pirellulales bacterium]
MNTNVIRAVFTRNFVSYFASPTGYVFICVFVLLSSFAAFWPNEFFNANLANLDQLNSMFPFIMLVFIPAITMSIWADERRQGTDELLLTIPAGDFDIVLGKYLAAVAIFSVSLLFSLACNAVMLAYLSLGNFDVGLFVGTYVGYWLVGLAMLAVGMVASFLTDNITVGFVLGAAFNAPLVFAVNAEAIFGPTLARMVKRWSIGEQFADFGRGMITLSGFTYFMMVMVVMLYLSMVLIGRRHWIRGRDWIIMALHYLVRTLSLVVLAVTALIFFNLSLFDLRLDATTEKLSSLSPQTTKLLSELDLKRPVQVEAFISPVVPESYVQTRTDLLSMLRELSARGGDRVQVRIHPTEQFSEDAVRAEQRFNITPRRVVTMRRGTMAEAQIFLGVAFTCGLEKVTLPFIDRGIPVEYELVRSICTVTQQKRKKIGIVQTDAQLYGRFNMQTMSSSPNWPIIDELEKMYEVEQVDPASPIGDEYDALLAVQPSSMGEEEMTNLVAAIRSGVPTAIFEDPFPGFAANVPGTSVPRQPPGGMNPMMMRQPPPPKGDLGQLWRLLGIDFAPDAIVWQERNPYRKLEHLPEEMVFVDRAVDGENPFNQDAAISSKLQLLLFPFPGSFSKLNVSPLDFEPLVRTVRFSGTVRYGDMLEMSMFGPRGLNPNRPREPGNTSYILAAQIKGTVPAEAPKGDLGLPGESGEPGEGGVAGETGGPEKAASDEAAHDDPHEDGSPADTNVDATTPETTPPTTPETADAVDAGTHAATDSDATEDSDTGAAEQADAKSEKPKDREINVILVADIDMLHREFFLLREQGDNPEMGVDFQFDNVTFVLNLLDSLAGDERFVGIRSRRPKHRTLARVDEYIEKARTKTAKTREKLQRDFDEAQEQEQKALDKKMGKLREDMRKQKIDDQEILRRVALALQDGQRRMSNKVEQLKQKQDREIKQIETEQALEIQHVQNTYKTWAVVLPPIPPLIVALVVFFTRRAREREGVARSRLR